MLRAVGHVNAEIADLVCGRTWGSLSEVDGALIELDGTATRSRLGANAIVGVSIAPARVLAAAAQAPVWRWLAPARAAPCLPVPHFDVVNDRWLHRRSGRRGPAVGAGAASSPSLANR